MPMIKPLLLGLTCSLLLAACGPGPIDPPVVEGTPSPTPGVEASTEAPPAMASLQILVNEMGTDLTVKPIVGADVEISSAVTAPQTLRSNDSGLVTFNNLRLDTEFVLRVSAKGYLPIKRQVNLQTLSTKSGNAISLSVPLEAERLSVTGQVAGQNGALLPEAVVFDGQQSVITDDQGQFRLARSRPETFTLRVMRQGYQAQSRSVTVANNQPVQSLGTIALSPSNTPIQVIFDGTKQPLGVSGEAGLAPFSQLRGSLANEKYQVQTQTGTRLSNISSSHVLIIPSPSQAYSADEQREIQAFVAQGGKLVVLGEWSGFGGFHANATNQLLAPMGVQFGEDILRENQKGFLTVQTLVPHFITQGLTALKMYQSCSVSVSASAQGQVLARTGAKTFRIASTGAFGTVVAVAHGNGKVVLIGDTSLWLDQDSDGGGTSNFAKGDNRKLALQVMAW